MSTSPIELDSAAREGPVIPRNPSSPDPYNIPKLSQEIEELGFRLAFSPQTPTTMATVEERALKGDTAPIIALTDHQTHGVGREGRVWNDTPGKSVLMSILLNANERSLPTYADLVALNVCQALRELSGQPIQLKWPNDIVYQDKKLGGILIRAIYDQDRYIATNVGIGINVHQAESELPPSDYGSASLDSIGGNPISRRDLILRILSGIQDIGPDAEVLESNPVARETYELLWQKLSSILGRDVEVTQDKEITTGKVIGTKIGRGLMLETTNGQVIFTQFGTNMKVRVI